MGAEHIRAGLRARRPRPMAVDLRGRGAVVARACRQRGRRAGLVAARRRRRALVGAPAAVPVGGPQDRSGRGAGVGVGAREGDGHAVRARRAGARAPARGSRTVSSVGIAVRTSAGGCHPDRSFVHDSRWHHRDTAIRGSQGVGGMTDQLLIDTANQLFAATCTHAAVQDAERDGWAPDVWRTIAEAGFPWASIAESVGGSGGTLTDAAAIIRIAGGYAAPVPLAETAMLGGWLASMAGLPLPGGPVTVVPGQPGDTLGLSGGAVSGRALRVPWGGKAERVVALLPDGDGWVVASMAVGAASVEPGTNLAGEPRDTLVFDRAAADIVPAPAGVDPDALRQRGALARALMMAGALDRMSRLTVEYTRQRRQVGRSRSSKPSSSISCTAPRRRRSSRWPPKPPLPRPNGARPSSRSPPPRCSPDRPPRPRPVPPIRRTARWA